MKDDERYMGKKFIWCHPYRNNIMHSDTVMKVTEKYCYHKNNDFPHAPAYKFPKEFILAEATPKILIGLNALQDAVQKANDNYINRIKELKNSWRNQNEC